MYDSLLKEIKKFDKITIFRHFRPDGDCSFSSLALREFLKFNFKDKKIKCVANDSYDLVPKNIKVSDSFIKDSLAIIVDCSNEDRTDDNRYRIAKSRFIIDHHPGNPTHAENTIVDTNVSATCELLAKIFYSKTFSKYNINPTICKYLYCGILTDSNNFKTTNTTSDTFLIANKLITDGKFKPSDLSEYVFSTKYENFKKVSIFRSYLKIRDGVGYVVLNQDDLDNIGMTFTDAKNSIDEFNVINEVKIWAVFAYNKSVGWYDGSVRSKRKYVINNLCNKYDGGGHKNACGVKKMTPERIELLINDLIKIANC